MGGFGRTSTALTAIWMNQNNKSIQDAINDLKDIRPQFMLTSFQKKSLIVWEKYLKENKAYESGTKV